MNEQINTAPQDTNADDGFLAGMNGEDYAEEQAEAGDTNPTEPQEEEAGESASAGDTNPPEESAGAETTTESTAGEQPPPAQNQPEGLEITFLGEKKQLSREEAASWAQKGMNAEHAQKQAGARIAQLEAELAAPRAGAAMLPLLRAYAQAMGSSPQELIQTMTETVRTAGLTVEKPAAGNYMREKAVREWQDFLKAYPDVRDPKTELAPEVWEAIKSGLSPRAAYIEHRQKGFDAAIAEKDREIAQRDGKIAELEQQIKTLRLNEENRKKSAGRLASTAEKDDPAGFLAGLMN